MKKTIFVLITILIALSFTTCFSPWDGSEIKGTGTISFNFGSAARASIQGSENFLHEVAIWKDNGAPVTSKRFEAGQTTGEVIVSAGTYRVSVKAYDSEKLRAYGIGKDNTTKDFLIQVKPEQNSTVNVQMHAAAAVADWVDLNAKVKEVASENINTVNNEPFYILINGSFPTTFTGDTNENHSIEIKDGNICLIAEKNVEITLADIVIDYGMFHVFDNAMLSLGVEGMISDLTLIGAEVGSQLIYVSGELEMYDRITITGHKNTSTGTSGSVYVSVGGKFTMYGGKIHSNQSGLGGGVCVYGGSFSMNGGEIYGNTAAAAGGGVYLSNSNFIKTGGTIYGINAGSEFSNAVKTEDGEVLTGWGHAVCAFEYETIRKYRDITSSRDEKMSCEYVEFEYSFHDAWTEKYGSLENPILIYNADELRAVGTDVGKYKGWTPFVHYKLMDDIDLKEKDWQPIDGNFTGSLDGNGYVIRNMKITGISDEKVGLFADLSGTVKNLGLIGVNIDVSTDNVGGIAGYSTGNIENCYVTGSVNGGSKVGGIIGCMDDTVSFGTGSLKNSYSTANVTGVDYVGGLVGNAVSNQIDNCVALNKIVTFANTGTNVGCITGVSFYPDSTNYARDDMGVPDEADTGDYTDKRNGTEITSDDWGKSDWWKALNWDATIWDFSGVNATNAPRLRGAGSKQAPVIP